jgi:hypothetical protein
MSALPLVIGCAMKPRKFSASFFCPNCKQAGVREWMESAALSRLFGMGRTLAGVSEGFHIETGRTASGEPIIVCNTCDEIQPD